MGYRLSFGSYTFPRTMTVTLNRPPNVVPRAKLARADGARSIRGSLNGRQVVVAGHVFGPSAPVGGVANLRNELDSLKNALHPNAPAIMYTGYDDRYLRNVSCEEIPEELEGNYWNRMVRLNLPLFAPDPFYYSTALYTDTWNVSATAQSRTFSPVGNEPALPKFTITVGGSGTVTIAFTILNNTTGASFTLSGDVTGGSQIVVDCLEQTVTIGGVDFMSLFDGRWIAFVAGVTSTVIEAYTSGTITQVATEYRARWL